MLLFFWLPSPEMAVTHVAKRVSEGGHNIPTETIHRRYWLGLQNFFNIFSSIVDSWSLYDNRDETMEIANETETIDETLFNKIKESCRNRKK